MFSTTLVFLLAAAGVRGECTSSAQQVAVTRMRETANPLTWLEMADKCQNRDNSVLLQSHARLSDAEKELCDNQLVPLGFFRNGNRMRFQEGSFMWEEDKVPGADLLGEHDEELDEVRDWEKGYAALDLVTGRWHLVSPGTTFGCALCQLAPVEDITDYMTERMDTWLDVYLYRVSLNALFDNDCSNNESEIEDAIDELSNVLPAFEKVVYRNPSECGLEVDVRVGDGNAWDLDSLNGVVVLEKFVMHVKDMSSCSEDDIEDNDGNVVHCDEGTLGAICKGDVNEAQGRFSTMECIPYYASGMAAWGAPRAWQSAHDQCPTCEDDSDLDYPWLTEPSAPSAPSLELNAFVGSPPSARTLDSVADVASRGLRDYNELDPAQREDLMTILSDSLLDSYAVSRPGVQIAVARVSSFGQTPIGLALAWGEEVEDDDEWPYPHVDVDLVTEYHHVASPRPQVSVALSPALVGTASKVAFVALWPHTDADETWSYDDDDDDEENDGDTSTPRFLDLSIIVASTYYDATGQYADLTYTHEVGTVACAAWNEYAWDYSACKPLESLSPKHAACRCNMKHADLRDDGAQVLRIALKTPEEFDLGVGNRREMLHSL